MPRYLFRRIHATLINILSQSGRIRFGAPIAELFHFSRACGGRVCSVHIVTVLVFRCVFSFFTFVVRKLCMMINRSIRLFGWLTLDNVRIWHIQFSIIYIILPLQIGRCRRHHEESGPWSSLCLLLVRSAGSHRNQFPFLFACCWFFFSFNFTVCQSVGPSDPMPCSDTTERSMQTSTRHKTGFALWCCVMYHV